MGLNDFEENMFFGPTDLSENYNLTDVINYQKEIENLKKENAELKVKAECAEPWIGDDIEAELNSIIKKSIELKTHIDGLIYGTKNAGEIPNQKQNQINALEKRK